MCCLSFPQLPARFTLKAPDVREMAKMTAGKFAIHYFFPVMQDDLRSFQKTVYFTIIFIYFTFAVYIMITEERISRISLCVWSIYEII